MKRLFEFERNHNDVDWDEDRSIIVGASTFDEAKDMAYKYHWNMRCSDIDEVEELKIGIAKLTEEDLTSYKIDLPISVKEIDMSDTAPSTVISNDKKGD